MNATDDPSERLMHIFGTLLIAIAILLLTIMFRPIIQHDSFRVVLLFMIIGSLFLGYRHAIILARHLIH